MTLLPLEDRHVEPVEGPPFDLNAVCAVPGCLEQGLQRHHIWRRSFIVGTADWVRIPDGRLVGNLVGLCLNHHNQVTVNSAWIRWEDTGFTWTTLLAASHPLDWQPPILEGEGFGGPLDGDVSASTPTPVAIGNDATNSPSGHTHDGRTVCPSCKRPLPPPKIDNGPEQKRPRRTWSITVPVDEREDGAETLDALLDAARNEMARAGLPYGEEQSVRFFVLSSALALFVQHAEEVLG